MNIEDNINVAKVSWNFKTKVKLFGWNRRDVQIQQKSCVWAMFIKTQQVKNSGKINNRRMLHQSLFVQSDCEPKINYYWSCLWILLSQPLLVQNQPFHCWKCNQLYHFGAFTVNLEQISHILLVFPLLTLNK